MIFAVMLFTYVLAAAAVTLVAIIIWNTEGGTGSAAEQARGRADAKNLLLVAWAWPVLAIRSVIQIARYKGE